MKKKLKKIPNVKTDKAADKVVAIADLRNVELSRFMKDVPVRFEFQSKTARLNMRIPEQLVEALKAKAAARGIPYQRFIRLVLEKATQ